MCVNDLVRMHKSKDTLKFNKPACVAICILEKSKVLMYEFQFYYVKNKYSKKSRLLFTDTLSLMHEIKIEDVYKNFSQDKEMFDFSNYSVKLYYDNSNKLKQAVSISRSLLD